MMETTYQESGIDMVESSILPKMEIGKQRTEFLYIATKSSIRVSLRLI
jgi:hypothetical protein